MNKPELLAPAGSKESLLAAVHAGCDAVYFGGKLFSARSYASNFDEEGIKEVVNYCKLRGVKTYIAINTLLKDSEFSELHNYLDSLKEIPFDALIVQDMGVVAYIKQHFPQYNLHGSTQMTVHTIDGVRFLEGLGFERVVLSRELSLKEIMEIKNHTSMEIECFVHGALCYAYSGQCLLSSLVGGRSGNRGRCAQPCRLPYQVIEQDKALNKSPAYLLSLKDIQTLSVLPELIREGIESFKIEGRMKRPEYVAGVTSIYRKYIDLYFENPEGYKVDTKDIETLKQLYNRGGFSEGYFANKKKMIYDKNPKHMGVEIGEVISYNPKNQLVKIKLRQPLKPDDGIEIMTGEETNPGLMIGKKLNIDFPQMSFKLKGRIRSGQKVLRVRDGQLLQHIAMKFETGKKLPLNISVEMKTGQPLKIIMGCRGLKVEVIGETVNKAINKPLEETRVRQQLSKMGNTPFEVIGLNIEMDKDVFIPVGKLNASRRETTEKMIQALLKFKDEGHNIEVNEPDSDLVIRQAEKSNSKIDCKVLEKDLTILVSSYEQAKVALIHHPRRIYLEWGKIKRQEIKDIFRQCSTEKIELFLGLPQIDRGEVLDQIENYLIELKACYHGLLIRHMGQFQRFTRLEKPMVLDHTFNIFNTMAQSFWHKNGAAAVTLSPELSLDEIKGLKRGQSNFEIIVYGEIPVMVTEQCPLKETKGCDKKSGIYHLNDRKGEQFRVERDCELCMSKIYNSKPIYLGPYLKDFNTLNVENFRLNFTEESTHQVERVIRRYNILREYSENVENEFGKTDDYFYDKGFTKGHYYRGVE